MKIITAIKSKNEIVDFIVDDEVYEFVSGFTWRVLIGYAVNNDNKRLISLHRLIMSQEQEGVYDERVVVRFKNGNKQDCRKENLVVGKRWDYVDVVVNKIKEEQEKINLLSDEEKLKRIGL